MTKVKILDGGFSAQLSTYVGAKIDGDPLWTSRFLATDPNAVYSTHLDFLRAGADIIETNTYQASVSNLMKYMNINEEESIKLLQKAVELPRKAINVYKKEIAEYDSVNNQAPMIAGSCGPYGASLHDASEYTGSYGKNVPCEVIMEWHRPRIQAFIDSNVDILALETIPCAEEAEALLKLLREFPNVKAWMSFSCSSNSLNIADGSSFQEVATKCYNRATPGQIVAVGVNCIAPKDVTPLLKSINTNPKEQVIPLIVYSNSGERYSATEGWVKDEDCPSVESFISEWLDLKVQYIGGCCRMYAANITSICTEVTKWHMKNLSIN